MGKFLCHSSCHGRSRAESATRTCNGMDAGRAGRTAKKIVSNPFQRQVSLKDFLYQNTRRKMMERDQGAPQEVVVATPGGTKVKRARLFV